MNSVFGLEQTWFARGLGWLFGIGAGVVVGFFAWMLGTLVLEGVPALSLEFVTSLPRQAGRAGGILPILVSSIWILSVCLLAAVPVGLATALFLAEFVDSNQKLGRVIRVSLDTLASVPSIVFRLFGSVFFCQILGFGFSILSGALTLAIMVLPMFVRITEIHLGAFPEEQRLAAASLSLSKTRFFSHILLPHAAPGILAAFVLSVGRALAETAALIFTSGYVDRMPQTWWDSGRAMSVHIYDLAMNIPGGNANAYATALILVFALLVINTIASGLSRYVIGRQVLWH